MPQLKIECNCEGAPDIVTMVMNGVVPVAQLVCRNCQSYYVSVGVKVKNA